MQTSRDLPENEKAVLRYMQTLTKPVTVRTAMNALKLSQPYTHRLLTHLVTKGFISRTHKQVNKAGWATGFYTLTEAGQTFNCTPGQAAYTPDINIGDFLTAPPSKKQYEVLTYVPAADHLPEGGYLVRDAKTQSCILFIPNSAIQTGLYVRKVPAVKPLSEAETATLRELLARHNATTETTK